ncbi:hypothetical protein [Rhizobium leguminosarum]|uniref:hypothetical protein n=1 Tax=Rhizobium leguminosarum TaxID=384 RepID=UPI000B92CA5C|nr:hypothetical protein [Rhizobium leguminosarum]ASS56858.1 hypothetical protein CHR56_21140 [Rhizobium leguminosarum bv. viciae]NEI89538.1 hypothetical protein [Rhizobium leguminosarum]
MDHFTPFSARVEPMRVIPLSRPPQAPFWLVALICSMSWAMALLSLLALGVSAYHGLSHVEQQIAWQERV